MASVTGAVESQHWEQAQADDTLSQISDQEQGPTLASIAPESENWNTRKINAYRTIATFWSAIVMGANDGAYGVSGFNQRYRN